jgi:hypothetical protein
MGVAQYATVDDVSAELGQDIDADSARFRQVQRWLDRAERMIRGTVAQLDEWCADDDYRLTVNDVEVAAVARKALNPEGLRSVMTQVDDANVQQTIDATRSTGEITILPDEWSRLLKIDGSPTMSIIASAEPDSFPLPSY